jgi:hypothetical protein
MFFQLKSEYYNTLTVGAFHWQEKGLDKIKCKVVGYRRGKPVLRNIDNTNAEWEINSCKSYKVLGFGICKDKKDNDLPIVKIEVKKGCIVEVRAGQWHSPELWRYE